MREFWYIIYALILGTASFFTGEIVTFVMLGFVLLSLTNILNMLKKISKQLEEKSD